MDKIRVGDAGKGVAAAVKRMSDVLAEELDDAHKTQTARLEQTMAALLATIEDRLSQLESSMESSQLERGVVMRADLDRSTAERAESEEAARKALELRMRAAMSEALAAARAGVTTEIASAIRDTQAILRAEISAGGKTKE